MRCFLFSWCNKICMGKFRQLTVTFKCSIVGIFTIYSKNSPISTISIKGKSHERISIIELGQKRFSKGSIRLGRTTLLYSSSNRLLLRCRVRWHIVYEFTSILNHPFNSLHSRCLFSLLSSIFILRDPLFTRINTALYHLKFIKHRW